MVYIENPRKILQNSYIAIFKNFHKILFEKVLSICIQEPTHWVAPYSGYMPVTNGRAYFVAPSATQKKVFQRHRRLIIEMK
jgi:hypothetical protein